MKTLATILCALFLCSSVLNAQYERERTRAGVYVTAGGNLSGATGWETEDSGAERIWGFNAGLTFFALLDEKGRWIFNLDGSFSQQGFGNSEATAPTDIKRLVVSYINVPAILKVRPFKGFLPMFIGAGPQIGFQVGGHGKAVNGEKYDLKPEAVVKNVWSGVGVVGFNFDRLINLGVEFSYHHGLGKFLQTETNLRHSVFQGRLILPLDFVADLF